MKLIRALAAGDHEQDSQGVHHEPGLRPGQSGERVVGGRGPVQVGAGDGNLRPSSVDHTLRGVNLRPRRQDRGAEEGADAAGRGRAAEDAGPPRQEEVGAQDHRGAAAQPQAAVSRHDREEGETRTAGCILVRIAGIAGSARCGLLL